MDFRQYVTPEYVTLAAGIAGGIIVLALIGLAIWNRRPISKGITRLWQNIFSQGGLFYLGMALFMLASVVEAGPVLNQIVMHGALFGYGGQLLVFAFDMIAAVSLRARLNARRVFDTRGMKLQMWGIWLPALVSISANLAGAIQSFNPSNFNHLFIFAWLLPLIGAVFPSMIVVLSLAADHLIDTTAINTKIDVEEFKQQERKRIDILKVRLSTEQELLEEEKKIAAIRNGRDQAQNRPMQEWFFMRWLRPYTTPPMSTIAATIEQAVNETHERIAQQTSVQLAPVTAAITSVQQALATASTQIAELATVQQSLAQQVMSQAAQLEGVASLVEGQHQQLLGFSSHLEGMKVNHLRTNEGSKRTGQLNLPQRREVSTEGAMNLQETGEVNIGRKERAFRFIANYQRRNEGAEPTLPEIMEAIDCSQGSASNYRSEYRRAQGMHSGELAALS